jgi:hypothetical protein
VETPSSVGCGAHVRHYQCTLPPTAGQPTEVNRATVTKSVFAEYVSASPKTQRVRGAEPPLAGQVVAITGAGGAIGAAPFPGLCGANKVCSLSARLTAGAVAVASEQLRGA